MSAGNIECEQSVHIYFKSVRPNNVDVRPFRWETEDCLLKAAATTHQRERIGAMEHDSATRGMIGSRQRHHLHPATEAENKGHNSAAKPDGVAKLESLLHVKVCKMQYNIENHMTLKSKISVESSMLHNRYTFNKDIIRLGA